ncbi:toll-interacting protein-like isoform X2 [Arctopsyche grandis]
MLGPLPGDFLQLSSDPTSRAAQQEAADRQAALALQQQFIPQMAAGAGAATGRLSITVVQAKLVKNYGMTRMDPYVRLRVGHCVYETHTDPSGGKNPRWNKIINCILPPGVHNVYLEIYDECSFTMDELVAWAHVPIPAVVMKGETHEDWYRLNGKQGDAMEGVINMVFSTSTTVPMVQMPYVASYPPVVMVPNTMMGYAPMAVYPAPAPAPRPGVPVPGQLPPSPAVIANPEPPPIVTLTEEELKQIQEMFPSIDKEVIKSVSEANRGNKDATVNSLLQMSE